MDINIDKSVLERMVREIIKEKLTGCGCNCNKTANGITSVKVPNIHVGEEDRLDTGNPQDKVYTKDLFTLSESKNLGCGIMEMTDSEFDWTLNYDEIDYVIEGELKIKTSEGEVSAKAGEIILIPKNSKIKFSVEGYSRFIYVTYPADWNNI